MSLQYDAFISYRHAPLDMEMAKKVHTALETYHIPRSVQVKTGKKKMGRVFRDQEELPIGSDLDNNISTALASSDYLLVICSPRTPDSYWVCKEIETFIEMHGRDHILAVLIEGEPDESFPKLLLTDDEGNPVEPLAADIRGETAKERNTKFKTEKLRLAAPIIGCTYDDLKQRHRERMIRRAVTIVSAAAAIIAAAGTAFGIYNSNIATQMKQLADEKSELADEKTRLADEILAEYKQKQENQSRFYAEEALSLLKAGNREDAVLVARAGLPSPENDRPYVAECENSLGKALYAYDSGNRLRCDRIIPHSLTVRDIIRSSDRDKLVVIDSGNKVYVYNTEDWTRILEIDPALKELNYTTKTVSADADETGIYVITEKGISKYDTNGDIIFSNNDLDYINGAVLDADGRVLTVASTDKVAMIDADTGKLLNMYQNEEEYSFMGTKLCVEPGSGVWVIPHYEHEAEHTYVSLYDPEDGRIAKVDVTEGYIAETYATPGGNFAVLSMNSDYISGVGVTDVYLDLITADGRKLWSSPVDAHVRNWSTFNSVMKAHSYPSDGGKASEIIVTIESEIFAYDENSGQMTTRVSARGSIMDLTVGLDSQFAYVSYMEGAVDAIDMANGELYTNPLIDSDLAIVHTVFVNGQVVISPYLSSDLYLYSYHEAPDLVELDTFDNSMVLEGTAPDSSYFVLTPLGDFSTYYFYDDTGRQIYKYTGDMSFTSFTGFVGNYFLIAGGDEIVRVDPFSGEELVTLRSELTGDEYGTYGCISRNGKYVVLWGTRKLHLIDTEEMTEIGSYETDQTVNSVLVSEDGKWIYVFTGTDPIYRVDTEKWEKQELGSDKLYAQAESSLHDFMCLSVDGTKFAMFCMDGYVRIVDTQTLSVIGEIPLSARLKMFIGFTDDGNYLVLQGDDGKLRIWDIAEGKTKSLTDTDTTINRIICDEEDGLMAVAGGSDMYLLETDGYGCKAYIPDGMTILSKDNTFVLCPDNRKMYMTKYKDYKELLKEADRQFPDSELDDDRRVKYNVE